MGAKAVIWTIWALNAVFSVAYLGVSMTSFTNIKRVSSDWQGDQAFTYKNGLLASCMIGFLVVLFWIAFSLVVLLSKIWGDAHMAYGIMLGTCIHTSWVLLLAGLVLNNATDMAKSLKNGDAWSQQDYSVYYATFGISYFLTATYIIMFLVLLFARNVMRAPSTSGESYQAKSATPAVDPTKQYTEMSGWNGQGGAWNTNRGEAI